MLAAVVAQDQYYSKEGVFALLGTAVIFYRLKPYMLRESFLIIKRTALTRSSSTALICSYELNI